MVLDEGMRLGRGRQRKRTARRQADVDIRVTQLFVERWLAGKIQDNPCK